MDKIVALGERQYEFRLYVAGEAYNALLAKANLDMICITHLSGRCTVDVVDVFREPARALADGIFMTPTLLTLNGPKVLGRIVGTLSETTVVLRALGL